MKLLQLGSVTLYPIMKFGAKTPRGLLPPNAPLPLQLMW